MNALKKKKMIEQQLEQVENNIQRVNEQQGMLENQRMTVETVGALQYGAHASKQTMADMKIENVDNVLEEISDSGWELLLTLTWMIWRQSWRWAQDTALCTL